VIHGFWLGVHHDEEGKPARLPRVTARGKFVRRDTKVAAKDVEELSNHIFRLTHELLFLMDFYMSLPIREASRGERDHHQITSAIDLKAVTPAASADPGGFRRLVTRG
jgi:hypothetical protein